MRQCASAFLICLVAAPAMWAAAAAPVPAPTRPATAAEIAVLTEALEKTAADLRRWAYTESRRLWDQKGRVTDEVVLRYDPSKPYAEQWTPESIKGKPPTDSDRRKYRRLGERAQKRDENPSSDRRKTLGEVIDLRTATIVSESSERLVFEVPLKKDDNDRFPPEKFEVLVRVHQPSRTLENISVRLRSSFRAKLVVNLKSGEASLDFATIDPKYPPTLTSITGDASASVLFISVGGQLEAKRTDLRHVKPYDERFEVKIGTLKAIDF